MARAPLSKERKIFYAIVIGIFVVVLVTAGILICNWYQNESRYQNDPDIISAITTNKVSGYDFDKLKRTYPDCIAWLDVPNTNITMPIVQDPADDYYYLNHDAQREYNVDGAAYIELCNNKDMNDPVTVVYGHNMIDDGMFATAHHFENPQFFNDNDKFYLYTPGHKYTYTVVSAYMSDDRHIINANGGFKDQASIHKYFSEVTNPTSQLKNVRSGLTLKDDDKLLVLSTCMSDPALANQRFVVTGVLSKDEPTN